MDTTFPNALGGCDFKAPFPSYHSLKSSSYTLEHASSISLHPFLADVPTPGQLTSSCRYTADYTSPRPPQSSYHHSGNSGQPNPDRAVPGLPLQQIKTNLEVAGHNQHQRHPNYQHQYYRDHNLQQDKHKCYQYQQKSQQLHQLQQQQQQEQHQQNHEEQHQHHPDNHKHRQHPFPQSSLQPNAAATPNEESWYLGLATEPCATSESVYVRRQKTSIDSLQHSHLDTAVPPATDTLALTSETPLAAADLSRRRSAPIASRLPVVSHGILSISALQSSASVPAIPSLPLPPPNAMPFAMTAAPLPPYKSSPSTPPHTPISRSTKDVLGVRKRSNKGDIKYAAILYRNWANGAEDQDKVHLVTDGGFVGDICSVRSRARAVEADVIEPMETAAWRLVVCDRRVPLGGVPSHDSSGAETQEQSGGQTNVDTTADTTTTTIGASSPSCVAAAAPPGFPCVSEGLISSSNLGASRLRRGAQEFSSCITGKIASGGFPAPATAANLSLQAVNMTPWSPGACTFVAALPTVFSGSVPSLVSCTHGGNGCSSQDHNMNPNALITRNCSYNCQPPGNCAALPAPVDDAMRPSEVLRSSREVGRGVSNSSSGCSGGSIANRSTVLETISPSYSMSPVIVRPHTVTTGAIMLPSALRLAGLNT